MDNTTIFIVTAVVALVVVVVAALVIIRMMRGARASNLRGKFGSEYDRTVAEVGRRKAEAELHDRETRVGAFELRPLKVEERERYVQAWQDIQAEFVNQPIAAAIRADALLSEIMTVRGYPVSDFDQRAADLSVGHADVVSNYRTAHDIVLRHGRGEATTEDLRQAMIHYRALFEDLVDAPEAALRRAS